jgi:hypothetical protein
VNRRVPRLASLMRLLNAINPPPVHEHVSSRAFAQPLAVSSLSARCTCFLSDSRSAGRPLLIFHTSYFPSPQFFHPIPVVLAGSDSTRHSFIHHNDLQMQLAGSIDRQED